MVVGMGMDGIMEAWINIDVLVIWEQERHGARSNGYAILERCSHTGCAVIFRLGGVHQRFQQHGPSRRVGKKVQPMWAPMKCNCWVGSFPAVILKISVAA